MAYTQTTRLDLDKAVPGSNQVFETAVINSNWDKVDAEAVAIDARFDVVEADITTIEGDITAIQGDITDIQADIAALPTPTVTTIAGSHTLLATNEFDTLRFTSDTNVTLTINDVLSEGGYINVLQDGAGKVQFVAGAGVTIASPFGAAVGTSTQRGWASIMKVAAGQYRVFGTIEVSL